jgi:hypothetical protein
MTTAEQTCKAGLIIHVQEVKLPPCEAFVLLGCYVACVCRWVPTVHELEPLKMGLIGCPEMLVINLHRVNIPEERKRQLDRHLL